MVPPPEVYFPSLDDCFSGEIQLMYGILTSSLKAPKYLLTDEQIVEGGVSPCSELQRRR